MLSNFIFQLVTVFLGSGAAIAIARIVFDYRKDRKQRIDATEYLALQLAFLLEGYAINSADKAAEHSTAISSEGHAGSIIGHVSSSPPFPESEAYKYLNKVLLNDVMDFPQRCQMAEEAARFWWNDLADEDLFP